MISKDLKERPRQGAESSEHHSIAIEESPCEVHHRAGPEVRPDGSMVTPAEAQGQPSGPGLVPEGDALGPAAASLSTPPAPQMGSSDLVIEDSCPEACEVDLFGGSNGEATLAETSPAAAAGETGSEPSRAAVGSSGGGNLAPAEIAEVDMELSEGPSAGAAERGAVPAAGHVPGSHSGSVLPSGDASEPPLQAGPTSGPGAHDAGAVETAPDQPTALEADAVSSPAPAAANVVSLGATAATAAVSSPAPAPVLADRTAFGATAAANAVSSPAPTAANAASPAAMAVADAATSGAPGMSGAGDAVSSGMPVAVAGAVQGPVTSSGVGPQNAESATEGEEEEEAAPGTEDSPQVNIFSN